MKNRILIYSINLIEIILQALIFLDVSLILSFALFPTENSSVLMCILVSVVPIIIFYIARFTIGNGLLILLLHVVVALLVFNAGKTSEEGLSYVIIGIVQFMFSMLMRSNGHKKESEKMPVGLIVVFVVTIIIGEFVSVDMLGTYGLLAGVAYIILNIIHRNISNFNAFIVINQKTANFPLKQMFTVNTFIMTILITICGGVMLICANKYVYSMFSAIADIGEKAGVGVLKFLFSLVKNGETEDIRLTGMPGDASSMLPEPEETNELIKAILDAIYYVLVIILAVLLVIGIAVLIIRLVRNLKSNGTEGDVKEFITPEGISAFKIKREKKEKADKSEQMNVKARKLYKNMVYRNAGKKGKHISDTMFPADISEQYVYSMKEEATFIYEKARYSNKVISKEELDILKTIQKNK